MASVLRSAGFASVPKLKLFQNNALADNVMCCVNCVNQVRFVRTQRRNVNCVRPVAPDEDETIAHAKPSLRADEIDEFIQRVQDSSTENLNANSAKGEHHDPSLGQKIITLNFGNVRFDAHNVTKYHGQFEDIAPLEGFARRKKSQMWKYSDSVKSSSNNNERKLDKLPDRSAHLVSSNTGEVKTETDKSMVSTLKILDSKYSRKSLNTRGHILKGSDKSKEYNQLPNLSTDRNNEATELNNLSLKGDLSSRGLNAGPGFIDEQYFSEIFQHSFMVNNTLENSTSNSESTVPFESVNNLSENTQTFASLSENVSIAQNLDQESEFIGNQYFPKFSEPDPQEYSPSSKVPQENFDPFHIEYYSQNDLSENDSHTPKESRFQNTKQKPISVNESSIGIDQDGNPYLSKTNQTSPSFDLKDKQRLYFKTQGAHETHETLRTKKQKNSKPIVGNQKPKEDQQKGATIGEPKSAYDYVMQKRKEEKLGIPGKKSLKKGFDPTMDSRQGHKILKNQVQDLRQLPKEVVFHILKSSIIYNANGIVAFNKPHGLASHGDESKVLGRSLSTFLEDLAQFLDPENPYAKLYPVHRLDRDTTGVHIFARTQEVATLLHGMFKEKQIEKTYWAVTRGVPDPLEGLISIPIRQGSVDDKERMVLYPELGPDLKFLNRLKGHASAATTYYKTLQSIENVALVEVKPETGVKHQIRVHLGFGLSCPVLGDHKYSNLKKLVPQKLPGDMLRRLNIRQSKARHVPLHLHAKTVVIPKFIDGKNVEIHAELPNHFLQNLQAFGFRKPK